MLMRMDCKGTIFFVELQHVPRAFANVTDYD